MDHRFPQFCLKFCMVCLWSRNLERFLSPHPLPRLPWRVSPGWRAMSLSSFPKNSTNRLSNFLFRSKFWGSAKVRITVKDLNENIDNICFRSTHAAHKLRLSRNVRRNKSALLLHKLTSLIRETLSVSGAMRLAIVFFLRCRS